MVEIIRKHWRLDEHGSSYEFHKCLFRTFQEFFAPEEFVLRRTQQKFNLNSSLEFTRQQLLRLDSPLLSTLPAATLETICLCINFSANVFCLELIRTGIEISNEFSRTSASEAQILSVSFLSMARVYLLRSALLVCPALSHSVGA